MLRRAIELGINWIDTAAGYGQGKSETNLGRALQQIAVSQAIHVATKVRLQPDQLGNIADAVRRSVDESLHQLRISSIELIQLHNGLTAKRGDEPFSLTPADAIGPVFSAFDKLRAQGLVRHLGLTATGQPAAMREVVQSGGCDTIQVPYNLLNPSAGRIVDASFVETDYGNVFDDAAARNMGVFAIRVFAGGALLGNAPSAHTLTTPFFPLDLYERDQQRAQELGLSRAAVKEAALRFVVDDRRVHSGIVGFGDLDEVEEAIRIVGGIKAGA